MKSGDIDEANAHLIGGWLQLLATGAYLVYLPHCIIILVRKLKNGLSPWLPAACVVMFVVTALDFISGFIRAYKAGAVDGGERPDPAATYADPSTKLSIMKNSMIIVVTVVSDIIMVYRTAIIWNKRMLVIFVPVGLLLSNIALGIWATWTLGQTHGGNAIRAAVSIRIRYFFIVTFVLNLLCFGLICYRIQHTQSKVSKQFATQQSSTRRVLEIIVESAGLYCVHLFILIVTNCVGTNFFFMFLDPLPPVAAYVFSMIIVRAGMQTMERNNTTVTDYSNHRFRSSRSTRPPISVGVEINLERIVDVEGGPRTVSHGSAHAYDGEGDVVVYTAQDKE